MTTRRPPRPTEARITDQDLRALISHIINLENQVARVIELLELQPPRGPRATSATERFYPGVGTVSEDPNPRQPSEIQRRAVAAAEAAEEAR